MEPAADVKKPQYFHLLWDEEINVAEGTIDEAEEERAHIAEPHEIATAYRSS